MTDLALSSLEPGASSEAPPVKPPWLRAVSFVGVVAAHGAVAWLLLKLAVPTIATLESISMELVPQGDYFESPEVTAAEEEPPPEEIEQPDLAIPPPIVAAPDAETLPQQKEVVEQKKKKIVERKREVDHDKKREAKAQRRLGAPEGQSASEGMSQAAYKAMLAAAIRRHTPGASALGEGTVHCSFHVTAGGGITGISATGSAAHAALARQILASVHAPPPPGGAFHASQSFHFHGN